MGAMNVAASREYLDHMTGVGAYTPTAPLKLRLMTANGSSSVAGTQLAGGSYAPATITFGAADTNAQATNSAEITFTGLPAASITGIEIWDSAGTPLRQWWGPLDTPRTVASGGTLTFPAGSIAVSLPTT